MTQRETELRLRAALATRAETGMSITDPTKELDRLHAGMERQTKQRRVRVAIISAAAAAAVAGLVIGLTSLGGGKSHSTPSGPPPSSATPTAPPTHAVVPTGFLIGSLVVPGSATHQALVIGDNGLVTFSDNNGQSRETLSFPAPGHVTFSKDSFLCQTPGRYRYTSTSTSLRFTVIADACSYRVTFLTTGAFKPV